MIPLARAVRLALLGLLLLTRPAHSQILGGNEWAAGAALNLTLRGPYVAPGWRQPLPRFVLGQAISVGYECAIDVHGWSWPDVRTRLLGYLLTETVIAVGNLALAHH